MKTTEYDLIIDADLQSHLPPPAEISETELERQLVENGGPDEPIRIWAKHRVIIDGHRRYEICKRLGLPYEIKPMDFTTIQEVKDWMDSWQASRRNLSEFDLKVLAGRLIAARRASNGSGKGKKEKGNAAAEVAEELGVHIRTAKRGSQLVEALAALPADLRQGIESKEIKISQADVIELSEMSEEDQRNIHKQVKSGEFKSFHDAIHGEEPELEREPAPASSPSAGPQVKPFGVRLNAAQKNLGILGRSLMELKAEDPISFNTVQGYIDNIEKVLVSWRKPTQAA